MNHCRGESGGDDGSGGEDGRPRAQLAGVAGGAAQPGEKPARTLVAGPPRSGTTLLASLLAKLGVGFGLETRAWNIDSGYYEHPQLLKIYGQIRKYQRLSRVSDNLASVFRTSAIKGLGHLLGSVEALKYPPISAELPFLMAEAGFTPVLAVSVRCFEPYAISRMRMEGLGYAACKADYLEIYRSLALQLRVYGGQVMVYEQLVSEDREPVLKRLQLLTGAEMATVKTVVQDSVGTPRSSGTALMVDRECREIYDQLVGMA
jgi:hypothetical protein